MSERSVERDIGSILATLKAIEDRLERADESRAGMHRRMDDLVLRTTHLEADLSTIRTKADGMERVTVQTTTLITKAQGAGTVGRWLIRVGIGVVSFAGWVLGLYTWLTGRPPP